MSEIDDSPVARGGPASLAAATASQHTSSAARPATLPSAPVPAPPAAPRIAFNRQELAQILRVYGRNVAAGEWRDYAIDFHKDKAIFSVFRHTSEVPLYRIEKDPKNARKQGAYSVLAAGGMILKRGRDLETVLRVLDRKRHLRVV
ncbi:DUF2794 domain-containing protein [Breoghania sp. L-A4]|uniref:DUF2794 domain-containing protein n=1 Tax=Breoghania sp. L-A4 TaxID=2304600 RepID=UPI000E35B1B5|nr:DUF2794 domain-containing protein [Breoghania sp. L-A4]AXS42090.1 DUF2794 domain-containing protein [Breoghania sp. L-A4]